MTETATKLVGDLYSCLLHDSPEAAALDLVCATVGAGHAIMVRLGNDGAPVATSHHLTSVAPIRLEALAGSEEYKQILAGVPMRSVLRMTDLMPRTEIVRTDLYQMMLRPLDGGLSACGVHLGGSNAVVTAICRSAEHDKDFNDETVALLRTALPHLATVADLAERRREDWRYAQSAYTALDAVDDGLLILDVDGQLLHANAAADAMFVAADRVRQTRNGICATVHADDARLQQAIRTAQVIDRGRGVSTMVIADTLQLTLRSIRPGWPLIVTITPGYRTTGAGSPGMVTIRLRDPEQRKVLSSAVLRVEYGLTPREASLVEELAIGTTLTEAASSLDLSVGTARQYLKSVFEKIGISSQAQLLRLVCR